MKKLTQKQIEAMAAKLDANGLGPTARVFDTETGEWTTAAEWRAKLVDVNVPLDDDAE